MKHLVQVVCVVCFIAFFSSAAWADGASAKGVINEIKMTDRKLNISHGPISDLGMGAMTMDFKVMDPAMLEDVKKGHEVAFVLEKDKSGNFVITEIEDMGMAKGMPEQMPMSGEHMDHDHMH